MQEPKAGRQIVSWGAYAAAIGKKATFSFCGTVLVVSGLVCMVPSAIITLMLLGYFVSHPTLENGIGFFLGIGVYTGCTMGLLYFGKKVIQKLIDTEVGIPLTRANTADLPAPDSLVRASQEPTQVQEGVLLRAASGETQTGQEEQLLRASVGSEQA